ncbi:hypothetical protein CBR_g34082 [Chara braunii]|uniref:Reverse transcriptase domain-containing protein n=1 Tax=Chara braunii TaxID=69332 RepID=A0A388LHV9_CHABU|nr:hypothetical protein CBR_g34082 [Chara braunii]|eukprot:GBG81898.1 hypothetical protein CBR_g34082 [Chara braunii]
MCAGVWDRQTRGDAITHEEAKQRATEGIVNRLFIGSRGGVNRIPPLRDRERESREDFDAALMCVKKLAQLSETVEPDVGYEVTQPSETVEPDVGYELTQPSETVDPDVGYELTQPSDTVEQDIGDELAQLFETVESGDNYDLVQPSETVNTSGNNDGNSPKTTAKQNLVTMKDIGDFIMDQCMAVNVEGELDGSLLEGEDYGIRLPSDQEGGGKAIVEVKFIEDADPLRNVVCGVMRVAAVQVDVFVNLMPDSVQVIGAPTSPPVGDRRGARYRLAQLSETVEPDVGYEVTQPSETVEPDVGYELTQPSETVDPDVGYELTQPSDTVEQDIGDELAQLFETVESGDNYDLVQPSETVNTSGNNDGNSPKTTAKQNLVTMKDIGDFIMDQCMAVNVEGELDGSLLEGEDYGIRLPSDQEGGGKAIVEVKFIEDADPLRRAPTSPPVGDRRGARYREALFQEGKRLPWAQQITLKNLDPHVLSIIKHLEISMKIHGASGKDSSETEPLPWRRMPPRRHLQNRQVQADDANQRTRESGEGRGTVPVPSGVGVPSPVIPVPLGIPVTTDAEPVLDDGGPFRRASGREAGPSRTASEREAGSRRTASGQEAGLFRRSSGTALGREAGSLNGDSSMETEFQVAKRRKYCACSMSRDKEGELPPNSERHGAMEAAGPSMEPVQESGQAVCDGSHVNGENHQSGQTQRQGSYPAPPKHKGGGDELQVPEKDKEDWEMMPPSFRHNAVERGRRRARVAAARERMGETIEKLRVLLDRPKRNTSCCIAKTDGTAKGSEDGTHQNGSSENDGESEVKEVHANDVQQTGNRLDGKPLDIRTRIAADVAKCLNGIDTEDLLIEHLLLKGAKLKAIEEEQAAKMKKLEEEMKRVQQKEEERRKAAEEEVAAEEEKERMRIESGEGSSGTKRDKDTEMEKKISEWVANLSLGEDEEAEFYVPQDERDTLAQELAAMDDPLERQEKERQEREEENKLEWKLRMKREKKRRRDGVNRLTAEVANMKDCRQEVEAQANDKAKWDKVLGCLEVLSAAWMEERQASWSQEVALSAMRSGFRDFARDMVTHVGGEVRKLRDNVGKFCEGAIEGAKAIAAVEGEARPRKEPVFVVYVRPVIEAKEKDSSTDPTIAKLLEEFKDLTESPTGVVPRRIQHRIEIEPGSRTPKGAVYKMSLRELEELRKQLDELLEKGWIRPNSSPFGAPVLFVPKKEGELRMCIDYRGLNAITVKNVEPLPRIDDLLDRVQGCKYFSKIDLKSGYHQIEVHPDDQYKTAFRTRYGHYEFIVMPLGLTKAPATFQRCMNDLFRPWLDKIVVVYLDDILVFSRTLQEHQGHLRQVLEKLREANFKVNLEKCEWAKTQVLYLGHILDGDGIKPEDNKIVAIRDWPTPRTLTELWSFLGLANCYRKFVRNFSTIAAPLRRLLKKEAIWQWDKDCTSALKRLKCALIEYPVLKVADPSLPFVVTTDASQYGIGAALQQDDGNGYRPVEFMSARMPSEKVATSTYERELYALRQALKHWKHYLLGRHFKVYSDHETLRWLKTHAKMTPKLTRWAAEIDQYDFELKPVKGKYNVVADAPSRRSDLLWSHSTLFGYRERPAGESEASVCARPYL